jgi:hypothetical protein
MLNQKTSKNQQVKEYWPSGEEIKKYYDGELCCNVYCCPQTKNTTKFIDYCKDFKEYGKNYAIVYECKFCERRYFKAMVDKNDPNPLWIRISTDEEIGRMLYEYEHDL